MGDLLTCHSIRFTPTNLIVHSRQPLSSFKFCFPRAFLEELWFWFSTFSQFCTSMLVQKVSSKSELWRHHTRRSPPEYKECIGSGICEHSRQRSHCKECIGSGICERSRQTSTYKDCSGSSICEHSRQTSTYNHCIGSSMCEHGHQQSFCVIAPCTERSSRDRKVDKHYVILMTAGNLGSYKES